LPLADSQGQHVEEPHPSRHTPRDPQYYRIRNHLIDFLVDRSKNCAGAGAGTAHDAKHPPVVRPADCALAPARA